MNAFSNFQSNLNTYYTKLKSTPIKTAPRKHQKIDCLMPNYPIIGQLMLAYEMEGNNACQLFVCYVNPLGAFIVGVPQ
jgi:hypothetical protein